MNGDLLKGKCLYLKIFGERHSGTNYLSILCAKNFWVRTLQGDVGAIWPLADLLSRSAPLGQRAAFRQIAHDFEIQRIMKSDFGWKHAAPPIDIIRDQPFARQTLFILITKHPYSWAQSLFREPYNFASKPQTFSEFIRRDFFLSSADCLGDVRRCNPLAMLRLKWLQYKRLMESDLIVHRIKYEDLLLDLTGTMNGFANHLCRANTTYVDETTDVKGSSRTRADFLAKYSGKVVGQSISLEDRAFIFENVGEDLFQFMDYSS